MSRRRRHWTICSGESLVAVASPRHPRRPRYSLHEGAEDDGEVGAHVDTLMQLRFTVANDVSSRAAQFAQSQWNYSKSFDGACPVGPAFVHKSQVKNIDELLIRGTLNGQTVQESKIE